MFQQQQQKFSSSRYVLLNNREIINTETYKKTRRLPPSCIDVNIFKKI